MNDDISNCIGCNFSNRRDLILSHAYLKWQILMCDRQKEEFKTQEESLESRIKIQGLKNQ